MRTRTALLPLAGLTSLMLVLAPAAMAARSADALVSAAASLADRPALVRLSERVTLRVEAARARQRRNEPAAALALLDRAAPDAARVDPATEGPLARPRALLDVGLAWHAQREAGRAARSFQDADGVVPRPPAAPFLMLRLERYAAAGLSAQAEALAAQATGPHARALLAVAARKAGDGALTARRAGEALALWRVEPAKHSASEQAGLAAALWRSGYPQQALEVAGKLPKAAWPRDVRALLEAITAEPPATDSPQRATLDAWLPNVLANCDTVDWQLGPVEAELLVAIARLFEAISINDRATTTLYAANDRLIYGGHRAGDTAAKPPYRAPKAYALALIGDAFFRFSHGKEGREYLVRAEEDALAGLAGTEPDRETASRALARIAAAYARAEDPDAGLRVAAQIPGPFQRGLALLAIDEAAPDAARGLTPEGEAALDAASK